MVVLVPPSCDLVLQESATVFASSQGFEELLDASEEQAAIMTMSATPALVMRERTSFMRCFLSSHFASSAADGRGACVDIHPRRSLFARRCDWLRLARVRRRSPVRLARSCRA